jgi:hypothetical protein
MSKRIENATESLKKSSRKLYLKPKLQVFGDIRRITMTQNSGGHRDSNPSGRKKT